MCQSVNFAKFLRKSFIIEHLWATASVGLNKKHCNLPLIIMILPTYHFYTVIFREKVSRIKQKEKGTWDKQVTIKQSLVQ